MLGYYKQKYSVVTLHKTISSLVSGRMTTLTDEEWDAYKRTHEKSYADEAEDAMRRDLVTKCKQYVEEHNKKYEAGEVSFTCGLNHFSDRTEEESKRRFGGKMRRPVKENDDE